MDFNYEVATEIGEILKKEGDKKRRLIGAIYDILIEVESTEKLFENMQTKWKADLDTKDAEKSWKECLGLTNKVTTNENLRLIKLSNDTNILQQR